MSAITTTSATGAVAAAEATVATATAAAATVSAEATTAAAAAATAAAAAAAAAAPAAAGAGAPAAMLPPAAILPPPVMLPPTIGNPAIAPNSILSMVIRNPFIVAILLEIIAYIMVLIAGRRANIITLNNKYDNTFPDIPEETINKKTIANAAAAKITTEALSIIARTIIPKLTDSNYTDLTQNLKFIIPQNKFFYYFPLTLIEKDKQDILKKYYTQRNLNLVGFDLDDKLKFDRSEFILAKRQSIQDLANMGQPIVYPLRNPLYVNWKPANQNEFNALFDID